MCSKIDSFSLAIFRGCGWPIQRIQLISALDRRKELSMIWMPCIKLEAQVMDSKSLWSRIVWRLIVNWLIVVCLGILLHHLSPAPPTAHIALGLLAAVLGLLAAGVFTAYSSLSIADAPPFSVGFYNAVDALVFCCMYLLLYLSVFCLYRIGIMSAIGSAVEVLLHIGLGLLLSVMHFIDVWDRVQNVRKTDTEA